MPDPNENLATQDGKRPEIYVGPRPFEPSERSLFFGRDREISELLSLVTSSRVVLCYSPSGAGKTSLINAGLRPRLEKDGFEVLPSTRVRGLIPDGIDAQKISNIYMFNALLSLAGEKQPPSELADCSLADFLSRLPHRMDEDGFASPRILMFDQFEELITTYPELWQERETFFHQVYDALQDDPLLRVVFIMREDFLARIEPFTRILKPLPQSHFRLDLLAPHGAQAAVTGPLQGTGKRFKEGVVASLIEELLKVRIETAQGESTEVVGEYVEPVQLQVVCRTLWINLPPEVQEISHEHLKAYGNADQALREFYESCIAGAKKDLRANEPDLRQWFEHQLITPAGTRGIVFRDVTTTAELPNPIVDFLENRHLIRGEWRAGSRWYELTHDRFIEPIQRANERWRAKRQARRTRFALVGAAVLLLLAVATIIVNTSISTAAPPPGVQSTAVASTLVSVQTTAQVQVQVAQQEVSVSVSRQLAAQALSADDTNTSLLLALEANRASDTREARRSLHKILSEQAVIDGKFLQEFNPQIFSPTLLQRFDSPAKNWVLDVAFSSDGRQFVSGGQNATLLLWDPGTSKAVPLTGHRSNVESVAYSPDGQMIASAGLDAQILLWDATKGTPIGEPLLGHKGMVTSVAFSPDGKRLASGGVDGTVRIWDLSTRQSQVVVQPAQVWSLAWSPDGKTLATAGAGRWVQLWDTETFKHSRELKGASDLVRNVAWSPDGRTVAAAIASEEGKPQNGEVILWDVESLRIIARPLPQTNVPARAIAFDITGKMLAFGRDDGFITIWDTAAKQIVGAPFKGHNHRVMSIAFSPDDRNMISGSIDGTIALWNLLAPTRSIAVSPQSDLLATSQGSVISLWDLKASDKSTPQHVLLGHTDDVLALAFSPDGNTLVSSGKDNTVRFWDARRGQSLGDPFPTRSNVPTLQFSPDGSTLALAGEDGKVQLFDIFSHNIRTLIESNKPIIKLVFGKGGKTLQAISEDGSLFTWDLTSNAVQQNSLFGAEAGISSAAISPDGDQVAYAMKGASTSLQKNGRAHGVELFPAFDQSFDPSVNPEDISFVIVKASEGLTVAPHFADFLNSIQSVPIRGVVHFFSDKVPWQQQADLFLSTVQDKGFHFYVLDLEVNPQDGSTQFLADAEQWLKYVQGKVPDKVLLETGSFYLTKFGPAGDWMKDWPLIVLQYPLQPDRNANPALPPGFKDWKIWNYTEHGNGADYGVGINNVDLDVYNGTPQEMREWLGIASFLIYNQKMGMPLVSNAPIQVTSPNGIVFSSDGSYLAASADGAVFLLDATTGEEISTLAISGRTILSLGFVPDLNMLAIGTDDGTTLLWDLSLLKSNSNLPSMNALACSQVQSNFTQAQWAQFFPSEPYRATCPGLP